MPIFNGHSLVCEKLAQVALIYGVRELELVGAVLRLSVKYGGRADVMLERTASFMRDLEHAVRELVAMSAETRLSSWVLAMLPGRHRRFSDSLQS